VTEPARKYWFPAKRYGWGWGPPSTWQGWVFGLTWLAAFVVGSTRMAPMLTTRPGLYALFVVGMVAVMLAVCFAKGEPPKWRWGDHDKPPKSEPPAT